LFAGWAWICRCRRKIVIALNNFIGSIFFGLIVVGAVGSVIAIKVWVTGQPKGAIPSSTTIVLKLPIIGLLMRKIAVARFTRTLGTLNCSGVPILEGPDITARTAGNAVVERPPEGEKVAWKKGRACRPRCNVGPSRKARRWQSVFQRSRESRNRDLPHQESDNRQLQHDRVDDESPFSVPYQPDAITLPRLPRQSKNPKIDPIKLLSAMTSSSAAGNPAQTRKQCSENRYDLPQQQGENGRRQST